MPKEERVASAFWPDDGCAWGSICAAASTGWSASISARRSTRELEFVRNGIQERLGKDGITLEASVENQSRLVVRLASRRRTGPRSSTRWTRPASSPPSAATGSSSRYVLTESWTQEVRERTMSQVLEVLRRRIDDPSEGIPDSVVTRQGDDRVLVQIPGGQIDRERARDAARRAPASSSSRSSSTPTRARSCCARATRTASLRRQVVVEAVDKETGAVVGAYLVPKVADITGDYLEDARVEFDQQQRPIVEFTFNPEGGAALREADREEHAASSSRSCSTRTSTARPSIRARISTRGMIEGRFTAERRRIWP